MERGYALKSVEVAYRDTQGDSDSAKVCTVPEAVRAKMFEPFFTTKTGEAGTGLGLSISNDIVRTHGGTIEVACEEGESSEFTVSLPIES